MRLIPVVILSLLPGLAMGQSTRLARLVEHCGDGQCQNALASTLAQIDLDAATNPDLNEELAVIALSLYQVARNATDDVIQHRVADALYDLADVAADPAQADLFSGVAAAIMNGDTDLYATEDPFSVSPS